MDVFHFRNRIRSWLVRLFPELEQRGLLLASEDFDMKVGGIGIGEDSAVLQRGIERCERAGSVVYVEVIPHRIPPPKEPLSSRVQEVAEKSRRSLEDPTSMLLMVSFYKFIDIERPDITSSILQKIWHRMNIHGRVYVAKEGINAQLAIPEVIYDDFCEAMNGSWYERGAPYIPPEVVGVVLNVDRAVQREEQPFKTLHVRPREKILADGLDESLDWNKSGEEVSPEKWHQAIRDSSQNTLVLDCRNDYESSVGRFEGAEPLNTRTFRETWEELEKRLQNEDRGKRILTYCTGGIRCVKVNAFLEQKMGFSNTGRLSGGIVSYAKELREQGRLQESAFKGVNHVFDGRMGEVVTKDLLDRCINCGQPCNLQTDCANTSCPRGFDARIFVQCEDCTSLLHGACSEECSHSLPNSEGVMRNSFSHPDEGSVGTSERHGDSESDDEIYARTFSFDESPTLRAIRKRTERDYPTRSRIMSSQVQASLLQMLVAVSNANKVLEIGTFTGYATLAMAQALPDHGEIIGCELDEEVAMIAEELVRRDSQHGKKVRFEVGNAADYVAACVRNRVSAFDLIFIDADKGGYMNYTKAILDNNLIRPGGIMVFDNVLFRGEVSHLWMHPDEHNNSAQGNLSTQRPVRNIRQLRKTATKMHNFNSYLKRETRLLQLVLPLRDGLTVAQRIPDVDSY